MEEIKVGNFVRLRDGEITRVKAVNEKTFKCEFHKVNCELFIDYIVKHSSNIKDLIEVGDYVNGRLVLQVDYKNKNVCLLIPLTDTKANTNIMWYGYEDIKTVVTKEQFALAEYRLEE